MTKFKIGDVVEITSNDRGMVGKVFTIETNEGSWNGEQSWSGPAIGEWRNVWRWRESHLKLHDPVEDAKAVLEKAGYTVTPPKPKRTGKAYVYEATQHSRLNNVVVSSSEIKGGPYDLIAIVDWTEGDGLTEE